jgi:hypothetical protein
MKVALIKHDNDFIMMRRADRKGDRLSISVPAQEWNIIAIF